MRLLDRYVMNVFMAALWVFLVAFLALFLVIDFSSKLARFLSLKTVAFVPFVAEYYASRIPLILMYVLPTLSLFAAMFTMIKLQKSNEVLPIVAAGVSLRRVCLPFVAASVLMAGVIAAIDEFALPSLMQRIGETDEILLTEEVSFGRTLYDARGHHIWAGAYNHVTKEMEGVVLTRLTPQLRLQQIVRAQRARWDADLRRWVLTGGTSLPYDENGLAVMVSVEGKQPQRRVDALPPEGLVLQECEILPEDLQRKFTLGGAAYSLSELNARLERQPGDARLLQLRHAKFATPLSSVIILLLGLPFVVRTRSRSFFRGLTLCLIVTAGYYVVQFGGVEAGKAGRVTPVLAAWAGPGLFGLLGLASFMRMRS